MTKHLIPLAALLLAGCAQPAVAPVAELGDVTAYATLDLRDADRHVLVNLGLQPWKKADIDHAKLYLYKSGDANPLATQQVNQADLTKLVAFNNLKRSTSYKIVAKAWSDLNETSEIDNGSVSASSCETSFTTSTAESVNVGQVLLTLKNKTFSGTTNDTSLNVVDGVVVDTTATETVTVKTNPI